MLLTDAQKAFFYYFNPVLYEKFVVLTSYTVVKYWIYLKRNVPAFCNKKSAIMGSVVHPDPEPAGSGIICKLGSGSVIISGFESGSKLNFVSNQQIQTCKNVQIKKNKLFCNV